MCWIYAGYMLHIRGIYAAHMPHICRIYAAYMLHICRIHVCRMCAASICKECIAPQPCQESASPAAQATEVIDDWVNRPGFEMQSETPPGPPAHNCGVGTHGAESLGADAGRRSFRMDGYEQLVVRIRQQGKYRGNGGLDEECPRTNSYNQRQAYSIGAGRPYEGVRVVLARACLARSYKG